jgi:hypothetical protein
LKCWNLFQTVTEGKRRKPRRRKPSKKRDNMKIK